MPKRIIDSTVPACVPPFTRGQGAVMRRMGKRSHFRSRDKDGGQTIRSAAAPYIQKPPAIRKLHGCIFYTTGFIANWSFTLREKRISRIFATKIAKKLKFSVRAIKVMQTMPKHIFAHYRQFQLLCYQSYMRSRCCFTPNWWVWSLPVTWQRWRSNLSIPPVTENPLLYANCMALSFIEPRVIADWSFTLRIGNFAYFSKK